jgi:hypothetical protein
MDWQPTMRHAEINGVKLTEGQAMTIHAALVGFSQDLRANGLGEDEHGKTMTRLYLKNIQSLFDLYLNK